MELHEFHPNPGIIDTRKLDSTKLMGLMVNNFGSSLLFQKL